MATRFIEEVDPTSDLTIAQILDQLKSDSAKGVVPLVADGDTGLLAYYDRVNAAARTIVNLSQAQTLSNKTIAGVGAATTGIAQVKGGLITELAADGDYSVSVVIPAGAVILNLIVTMQALWTAGTSATLIVGDTTDDDGFFTGIDAKAAPAVGTSVTPDTVRGGTGDGAYLGDTNSEFIGPATANFGRVYVAGSTITCKISKVGTGTGGRTWFHVVYALPSAS